MRNTNKVFIATSLDGFIADKKGGIDWLDAFPAINQIDTGYGAFMAQIDALLMGRNTFETVCSFDIEWPYEKPVFVLSNRLKEIPKALQDKVKLVSGPLQEVLDAIHQQGHHHLYIDGGKTIQSFLKEDLIDEMIITTIPFVLGGGIPLFSELPNPILFECVSSQTFLGKIVQSRFVRNREK
ncbi:MAG: dihydrofolate reductase [Algoriphagus sp.]|uniref:dihydrofolate reductase family protein n=1 Tax=Algoriphagus sp. TaxID=1872435 RepID=UPI0018463A3E|nr:dihydrofolate reductase family protein [Algoriphagus sp.]NVJ87179.1 dihydrofolate reductase [Algoriphagus sp.]